MRKVLHNADIYHFSFSIFLGLDCNASSLGFGEEVLNFTRSDVSHKDHVSGAPHRTIIMKTTAYDELKDVINGKVNAINET